MKKAAILAIGSELMKGKMDDSNSTYISRWLHSNGIIVKWRISVGDDIEEIVNALNMFKDCDIIITTGGLGPTDDDCTREAVSKFLNRELVFNEEAWKKLEKMFLCKYKSAPQSNRKQADLIKGGVFLTNKAGTAPGIYVFDNNTSYFLLPGPPRENQLMLNHQVIKILKEKNLIAGVNYSEVFKLYNIGESTLADLFIDFKTDCNIGYYFSDKGWIELHINKSGAHNETLIKSVDDASIKIKNILDKNNIFYTENKDLGLLLLNLLKEKKMTISFAESITGGNLTGEFVKNAGASSCLSGSVVVYSNESKIKLLDVKEDTINKYGAVSSETVKEMVYGLKKIFNTDICVSVSGIAGPTGATKDKPLGLVHYGFFIKDKYFDKKEVFLGDRYRIMKRAINYAFIEIIKYFMK